MTALKLICLRRLFIAVLTGSFLTIILTWPFIFNLKTFYDDKSDYALSGAILKYNFDSIRSGRIFNQEEHFNGFQQYPLPYSLVNIDNGFVPSLIFAPFYLITKNLILSVNLVTLSTFVLTFVFSFWCLNYFVKNSLASLIGATIFTFNPITFAHYPEHFLLLNKYFLLPFFLFVFKYLVKPNLKDAFLALLFLTLIFLSSVQLYLYTLTIIPLLAAVVLIRALYEKEFRWILSLWKHSFALLIFLPLHLYLSWPYLQFSYKEGVVRGIEDNIIYSAKLTDWLSPHPSNLIYKPLVNILENFRAPRDLDGLFNYAELTLFLNLLPTFLFCLAVYYLYKREKSDKFTLESRLFVLFFFTLLLITAALTFGPYLVDWQAQFTVIPMPYYLFYNLLPSLKGIQTPPRFEFLFYVSFSILATYGASLILEKYKKYQKIILASFLLILVLENLNPRVYDSRSYILDSFEENKSRVQIQSLLKDKKTLHLPTYYPDGHKELVYLNWAAQTQEKTLNGNTGYHPTDLDKFMFQIKENLDGNKLKELYLLGFNYLIVHKDLMDTTVFKKMKTSSGITLLPTLFEDEKVLILELKGNFSANLCDPKKDFSFRAVAESVKLVLLKNEKDCYLVSVLKDRYRRLELTSRHKKQTFLARFPIIIGPYETVIVSRI